MLLVLSSNLVFADFTATSSYSEFELCKGESFTDTITIENNNPEEIVIDISQKNDDFSQFSSIVPDEVVIGPFEEKEISHIIWAKRKTETNYQSELVFESESQKKSLTQDIKFFVCDNFKIEVEQVGFSNCPCVSTIYSFNIENTGGFEDTYNFSMDINEGFYNLSEESITLEPGMEKSFYADVRKPCDISGNFSINLRGTSKSSGFQKEENLFLSLRDDCYDFDFYWGNTTKNLTKDFVAKENHTYKLEINETINIPFSIRNTGKFNNSYDVEAAKPDFMELYWENETQIINETGYGYIEADTTSVDKPEFEAFVNVSANVGYNKEQFKLVGYIEGVQKPWYDGLYIYFIYAGVGIVILLFIIAIFLIILLKGKKSKKESREERKDYPEEKEESFEAEETSATILEKDDSKVKDVSNFEESGETAVKEKEFKDKTEKKSEKKTESRGFSSKFILLIAGIFVLAILLLGSVVFFFWPTLMAPFDFSNLFYNETVGEIPQNLTVDKKAETENVTVDVNKTEGEPYITPPEDVNVTEAENKTAFSKISDSLAGAGNFLQKNYLYFIVGLVVLLLLITGIIYREKMRPFFIEIAKQKKTVGVILIISGLLILLTMIFYYGFNSGELSFVHDREEDTSIFGLFYIFILLVFVALIYLILRFGLEENILKYFLIVLLIVILVILGMFFYYSSLESEDYYGKIENPSLEELQAIHPDLTEENLTHYVWPKNEEKTIDLENKIEPEKDKNITYYMKDIENITIHSDGLNLTLKPEEDWEGNRLIEIIGEDLQGNIVSSSNFVVVVIEKKHWHGFLEEDIENFFTTYYIHIISFLVLVALGLLGFFIYSKNKTRKKETATSKALKADKTKKRQKKNTKKSTSSRKRSTERGEFKTKESQSKKKKTKKNASTSSEMRQEKKEEESNSEENSKNPGYEDKEEENQNSK